MVDTDKPRAAPLVQRSERCLQLCDGCGNRNATYGKEHRSCQSCLSNGLPNVFRRTRSLQVDDTARSGEKNNVSDLNPSFSSWQPTQNMPQSTAVSARAGLHPNTYACESERAVTNLMAVSNNMWDFPALLGSTTQSTSSRGGSAVPNVEYGFNVDLEYDTLCNSDVSSTLLADQRNRSSDGHDDYVPAAAAWSASNSLAGIGDQNRDDLPMAVENHTELGAHRFQEIMHCPNSGETCIVSALTLLQALHTPSNSCLSANAEDQELHCSYQRTTEAVFSTNREAVQVVADILKCSCSSSFQLQLVLVILCSKLTAWYRATIRYHNENLPYQISGHTHSDINQDDLPGHVVYQPITIGKYTFDAEIERQVQAQVVSSELQRVRVLIEAVTKRMERTSVGSKRSKAATANEGGIKNGATVAGRAVTGLATVNHEALTTLLRDRLSVTMAEIRAVLSERLSPSTISGSGD